MTLPFEVVAHKGESTLAALVADDDELYAFVRQCRADGYLLGTACAAHVIAATAAEAPKATRLELAQMAWRHGHYTEDARALFAREIETLKGN